MGGMQAGIRDRFRIDALLERPRPVRQLEHVEDSPCNLFAVLQVLQRNFADAAIVVNARR
jgi:hypothetical protein